MILKHLLKLTYLLCFLQLPGMLLAGNITVKPGSNAVNYSSVPFESLNVTVDVCTLDFRDVRTRLGTFTELIADGFGFNNTVGEPKLPVYHKLIQVPVDAGYDIQINYSHYRELRLSEFGIGSAIIPAQAPLSKSITDTALIPFVMNSSAYQQNRFTEEPLVNVSHAGTMRAVVLARLDISPVQYNPATGVLRVYDRIDARVVFTHPDLQATKRLLDKYASPYYQALYSRIPNYTKSVDSLITSSPATFAIVAHSSFKDSLARFIAWKTRKGFKVIAAYTDNPAVGTTTNSIKNYLQNLYLNPPSGYNPPSFVLLVGDVGQIPAFNNGGHPSDMYYCEYTGDNMPEVTYGRFAAQNQTQLNAYIDKTLEYEQYTMPSDTFLGEAVMIAGADPSNGPLYGNGQINYGTNNYFNSAHNLLSHTYLQPEPSGANYSLNIRQNVSNGVGFANYTAHGSESGWSDPSFSISNISALQNAHKYPLMIGNCCKAANFGTTCFAKEITRAANKGALGYIGCSDYSYWDEDYWWACGYKTPISVNPPYLADHLGAYDKTFHDHGEPLSQYFLTMGQMVQAGCYAVEESSSSMKLYYWQTYCLMGDPSLSVYYSIPPALDATFAHTQLVTTTSLNVTTEPLAYVALSINDSTLLDARCVDSTGITVLHYPALSSPGFARLIITKQNHKPLIDSVHFIPAIGPYVTLDGFTINDSLGGNNNHQADYNEHISLSVTLYNLGVAASGNVNGTLSTSDTNIVINQGVYSFGVVAAGGTITGNNAFALQVKDNVADQYKVTCTLALNDGVNSWSDNLEITLNAPILNVSSITVLDPPPGGNNNGVADPGETATLKITMTNDGHARAVNTTAHLKIDPQSALFMLVTNPDIYLGDIPELNQGDANFNVLVNGVTPIGTDVYMNYEGFAGLRKQYVVNNDTSLQVGQIPVVTMFSGTETTCGSWFYDSGGPLNNYSNNEDLTLTFNPATQGGKIKVKFYSFDLEASANCTKDYLKIYNGTSIYDPLFDSYCGSYSPDSLTASSPSGAMTFEFHSSPTVNKAGWKAFISCVGLPLSFQANAFPATVCEGGSSQLGVIPNGGSGSYTYVWSPPTYLNNSSSQFPVSVPLSDISYTVTVSDGYSTLTSSPIQLTVAPVPAAPVIAMNGTELVSDLVSGNQWFMNGNAIPGATDQTYQPSTYGNYTAVYTDPLSLCSSLPSNIIMYYPTSTTEMSMAQSVVVYPNPFNGKLTIAVDGESQGLIQVSLYDMFGNRVLSLSQQTLHTSGKQLITLDAGNLNPGMYFCRVQTENHSEIRKVILDR